MGNQLDLPPELQHLLEKREESERREQQRRKKSGRIENEHVSREAEQTPDKTDRREETDRRVITRRIEDQKS